MKQNALIKYLSIVILLIISCPERSVSFALLSHEAIIDDVWEKSIVPLLNQKYPGATKEELKVAHANAYGGAIIPDIGYYPLGSPVFSHLVHYVRSGDFISALLEEAHTLNEYAFALGVLCHYEADKYGHSLGTNKAVAILFPRLKNRYGNEVTFEQGHDQHSRVEFGFDVLQAAKGNYQTNEYHDFIGFEVSDSVLERAFLKTYGLSLKRVFRSLPTAIAVFRFSVKVLIPELTKDAWKIKNSFITKMNPLATEKTYIYKFNRKDYRNEFSKPAFQSIFISLAIGILPKYGPLSRFKPMYPDSACEKIFHQSYDAIRNHFTKHLKELQANNVSYDNIDLDTGKETVMGEYKLADQAYYQLLMMLKKGKFVDMEEGLKKNLIAYYKKQVDTPYNSNKSHKEKNIALALKKMNTPVLVLGTK